MTGKIFKNAFIIGAAVLLLCALLFFGVQYAGAKENAYSGLRREAVFASNGVMLNGSEYLESLSGLQQDYRITWIASDGEVLFDSVYGEEVTNQKDFPEVAEAFEEGEGQVIRESGDGGDQTMYYALLCDDGTVLRLSRPLSAVRYAIIAVSPLVWIFILVLIISGVLAFRSAKQLIKPINSLQLDDPDANATYPELAPLVERIRDQKLTIQEQMDELNRKQREFAALTENMSEGFVLTDRSGVVLSSNSGAERMIPGCEIGADLVSGGETAVSEPVKAALEGKRTDRVFTSGDQSRQLIVNPVISRGKVSGAVILVMDVTEREQRERLRREFSANVSHELKTPLTSISGFAELMMQELVTPDKVKEFSGDIYRESQRLIALVSDIIKLSKLDEQDDMPAFESVDLFKVASGAVESLLPFAESKNVSITVKGESCRVKGVAQFIDEIVFNLCDNAVKYNREGGSVEVEVSPTEGGTVLKVSDTGIGIPYEHQSRVFERFYRVNKSHSKEVAGTGLGLSIVKHAAQFHKADISLTSEPGKGTVISLVFPR